MGDKKKQINPNTYKFDTLSLHAGYQPHKNAGSRQVPIYQTTSYLFDDVDHAAALFNLERGGHIYSRISNPTVAVLEEINVQARTILFDLDKATIRKESYETLNNVAEIMKEYPNTQFLIEGHTDSQGSDSYNMNLSKERAASVKEYLVGQGLPASRLSSEGFGETRPIATNATAAGRQKNRRVEISLID